MNDIDWPHALPNGGPSACLGCAAPLSDDNPCWDMQEVARTLELNGSLGGMARP